MYIFSLALSQKLLYSRMQLKTDTIFQRRIRMKEKVILAYSGGLDTTAIIPL